MKVKINPGMFDEVVITEEDFDRNGIDHDDVVFNRENEFEALVTKEIYELLQGHLGEANVTEADGSEPEWELDEDEDEDEED